MTVTYTSEVTTSKGISCFLRLLARWRGSIYKIVWVDLFLFLFVYYGLAVSYTYSPDGPYKQFFVRIVKYCQDFKGMIPLSFVLGFYVNIVMTRWWSQYTSIPFPDNLAILVGSIIKGQDDRARIVRRTIVRYACVTFTITLTMMSPKVKKRFPTLGHFVDAGLISKEEKKIMEDLDLEYPSYSKYWLPLAWASNITTRARHEGLILDDEAVKSIVDELNLFRSKCGGMLDFDWISVPLVYTQVVTLAVYSYFLISVFANQFMDAPDEASVFYVPIIPILEFFFYMGWLKVAETLINPYGEDDDDFEVMWMIDRHLQVSYLLVDKIHHEHPKLMKDAYWEKSAPNSLPYTIASQNYMADGPSESTKNITVKKNEQDLLIPETRDEVEGRMRRNETTWDRIKNVFSKRRIYGIPLKSIKKDEEVLEEDPEINEYMATGPNKIIFRSNPIFNDSNSYVEEYEKLKQQRLREHKEKVLTYLHLLKSDNIEEQKNIIEDMGKKTV